MVTLSLKFQNFNLNYYPKYSLVFFIILCFYLPVKAQPNITRVEYYIDTDPGYGNGINVPVLPGTNLSDVLVNINPSSLTEGVHQFSVRAKDANGAWSLENRWLFVKPYTGAGSSAGAIPNLSKVEYYIDTDPGYGNGINIPISPGTNLSDVLVNINPASLTEGVHQFSVRAKDANGAWSLENRWLFVKPYTGAGSSAGTMPNLSKVEYYIDTDPGYGNGISVPISPGINLSDVLININPASLTEGVHQFFVRAKDANGAWSLENRWLFVKPYTGAGSSAGTIPNLSKVEYYIDTDPGYGNGINVPVLPLTDISNLIINANITSLVTGTHRFVLRAVDVNGGWSLINSSTFAIQTNAPPFNALSFDGTNDYVNMPSGSFTAYTIEAWVRFNSSVINQNILAFTSGNPSATWSHQIKTDSTGKFVHNTNDGTVLSITGNTILKAGIWYHVAISALNGGTMQLYVNGLPEGAPLPVKTLWTLGNQFVVGSTTGGGATFFNGQIDELRIWNKVRTAEEIKSSYANTLALPQDGLIASYNFDEGTAGAVNTGLLSLKNLTGDASLDGKLNNFGLSAGNTSNWVESYAMVVPEAFAAINITGTSFTASWAAPAIGTINNYYLDVSTDSLFNSFSTGYNGLDIGTKTTYNVINLFSNTKYFYRVRANKLSVNNQGGYSQRISFITLIAQPPTIIFAGPVSLCQGDTLIINGTNFTNITTIKVGNIVADTFIIVSSGSVKAIFKSTATGVVSVTTIFGSASSSLSIIINGLPIINAVPNQIVCNGFGTTAINFSGTESIYNWINSDSSIGLSGSGTGNINSFAAINNKSGTVSATITAIPVSALGCIGASINFTINVNPTPTVISPVAQNFCNGQVSPSIILSGTPSGVLFDISGGSAIGLFNQTAVNAIPSFNAVAGTANIIIVPKANGCTGNLIAFQIAVNSGAPLLIPILTKVGRNLSASTYLNGSGITGYQWKKDGVEISGAVSDNYYAIGIGNYTVSFSNLCGSGPLSNAIIFTATAQTQSIVFPSITTQTFGDSSLTLNAIASSSLPISYFLISSDGILAGNKLTVTGAGLIIIEAVQIGNDVFASANPVRQTFIVNKLLQTISIDTITNKVFGNAPFIINALASSGLPVTYSVIYGNAYITSGNTIVITGAGIVTVNATQGGNQNYLLTTAKKSFCVAPTKVSEIFGFTQSCISTQEYYIDSIPGASYLWLVSGGGNILSNSNRKITVNWTNTGNHKLSVITKNTCEPIGNDTTDLNIQVVDPSVPLEAENLFPVNATLVSNFPLVLSWQSTATSVLYDIYIWPEGVIEPTIPYAANSPAVAFIINNSNALPAFAPGKKYFWKVVTKNACRQSLGITSSFVITNLPNLVLENVQAPDTTFSGKSIDVAIKVLNNGRVPTKNITWAGSGNYVTGQAIRWTDAVYLSRDTIFNPIFDILVGSANNLSALDSGEEYISTIHLNLPQNVIGNYFLIVITNASSGLTEITHLDDTIIKPILINLTAPPDLQVTAVISPNEAFSAQYINVAYTVKNKGTGQTNALKWVDYVYISPDPVFDRNTAFKIGENTHIQGGITGLNGFLISSHLLPDSSYTTTVNVLLPARFFGIYYIFVETDVKDSVYEFTFENNNTNRNDSIKIFLTPPPDLVVREFAAPAFASSQEILTINYKVQNNGATAPPATDRKWADAIYISKDSIFDIKKAQFLDFTLPYTRHSYYFCLHASYGVYAGSSGRTSGSGSVGGFSYGVSSSYSNAVVQEYCNTQALSNIQYFDGFSPIEGNYTGTNGCGFTDYYPKMIFEEIYDNKISAIIPDSLSGTYYLHLYTDASNNIFEFLQKNNNTKSSKVTILNPDLIVDSISIMGSVNSGGTVNLSWTVKNQGAGKVFDKNRKDLIWISSSPVYNSANIIKVDSFTYCTAIENGARITKQKAIKIPDGISGDYYLFVETDVDKNIFEGNNEGNNYLSMPIKINLTPWPDLRMNYVQTSKDSVEFEEPFDITYKVSNNGIAAINGKSWNDLIYISNDRIIVRDTANGYEAIAILRTQSLDTGASYSIAQSIMINSNAVGKVEADSLYDVYVFTDGNKNIYEYNAENNNIGRVKIAIRNVDLAVTEVVGETNVFSGDNTTINWTVLNKGGKTGLFTQDWSDVIYLSADTVLDANDTAISSRSIYGPVLMNGTYTNNMVYQIPNGYSGKYYILVNADNGNNTKDNNRLNNVNTIRDKNGVPVPINITLTPSPDLVITTFQAPSIGYTGQPIIVKWQVKNIGIGPTKAGGWVDNVYLTTNINAKGTYLGSHTRSGDLVAGQAYTDSLKIFLPMVLSGNYYLLIETDGGISKVYEYNAENNNTASSQVFILQPLPSDLIVSAISNSSQVLVGDSILVSWKVKNIGLNPAEGYFAQGIYLSKDTLWSVDDVLLKNRQEDNVFISPLTEMAFSDTIKVRGIKDGKYFVIIRTDLTNNIFESNENNNISVSVDTVSVYILNLPVNVLTTGLLQPKNELYYKLEIPDSLNGETMLVTLRSPSLITPNEIYIKYGDVPTRASFDYGYENGNSGYQEILIPVLTKGTYYILAYNNAASYPQNISLLAQKISYSIRSVNTNEGGNTGIVTIKIRGAKFEPNMQISLQSVSLGTIAASSVQYVNSTTIFASFNLSGKTIGKYNVIAKKIQGDTTSLSNGFTIIDGSGGGFQQGGTTSGGFYCTVKNIGVDPLVGFDVQSPSTVRVGQFFKMDINFGNSGNVDVPMPSRLLISISGAPISLTQDIFSNPKRELFLEFKEANGPEGILRPGATGSITIYTNGFVRNAFQFFRLIE